MKRKLLTFILSFAISAISLAQTNNVTFQVYNPDSTPVYVFGSWSNFGNWPGDLMTSIGNGYYTATIPMPSSTTYEFLYVNGVGPTKETLDPAWPCTNGNATYTNRIFNLGNTDTTLCYTWQSCATCSVTTVNQAVTFQVHNPDSTPVYIIGSWNWANYPGISMASIGNGYYAATIFLAPFANYEFLYLNGVGPTKEVLDSTWACTNGNPQYTNRTLALGGSDTTICFDWQSCNTCFVPTNTVNVTFRVVSPDSTPVYIFGSWNGWSNYPGVQMTASGVNTYDATVQMTNNQNIEYLFVEGVGPTKETLDPSWPCTNGNPTYTNRTTTLGASDTTICGVWSSCNSCGILSVNSIDIDNLKVSISKSGISVFSDKHATINHIEVYDLVGRNVYFSDKKSNTNSLIPIVLNSNSLYLIKIKVNNEFITVKAFTGNY